jgi:hypothetical protein
MITAIEIENFKSIGTPLRVELKPITLLFGANSSGKSTILQCIHYAREVFDRRNLNADKTATGGKFVDLGGFRNFVHGRDLNKAITLKFDLDLKGVEIPTYVTDGGKMALSNYDFPEINKPIQSAKISITIAWSNFREEVYVQEYAVEINGAPLARITSQSGSPSVYINDINYRHEVFPAAMEDIAILAEAEQNISASNGIQKPIRYSFWAIENQQDALPNWNSSLQLAMMVEPGTMEDSSDGTARAAFSLMDVLITLLSHLVVGPGQLLRDTLQAFRYLGPIRETPPRGYTPPNTPDSSRWSSGLAAWDLLTNGSEKLVQKVSNWLSQPDRLNTNYRLERRRYKKLDISSPLVLSLVSGRAFDEADESRINLQDLPTESQVVLVSEKNGLDFLPHDIGIGISQLLPIVVAATESNESVVVIEQPELHVHPRIQSELGDLFIETSIDGQHEYLIETHSEHLILRILRRIRETSNGKPHNGVEVTGADIAVYFVKVDGDQTCISRIDIDSKGDFVQPWPDDFFEIDFYERFA